MPGIPTTSRCSFCKARKIKIHTETIWVDINDNTWGPFLQCDERWPTCGPCQRGRRVCSGPPRGVKFVHLGCHGRTKKQGGSSSGRGRLSSSNTSTSTDYPESWCYDQGGDEAGAALAGDTETAGPAAGQRSMVTVSMHSVGDGGAIVQELRLFARSPPPPKSYPTTLSGRVAARLASRLEANERDPATSAGYDLSMSARYWKLIPQRIAAGGSAALRDAAACFLGAWGNFRRGGLVAADGVIDVRSYGKALRSLQRALDDAGEQREVATLAATCILNRLELFFDPRKTPNNSVHSAGLCSLMIHRGPPRLEDELDVLLSFDVHGNLLYHWLIHGGESFYLDPAWKALLDASLDAGMGVDAVLEGTHRIVYQVRYWPTLVHSLASLRRRPAAGSDADDDGRFLPDGLELVALCRELAAQLAEADEVSMVALRQHGRMIEVPDGDDDESSGLGSRYEFTHVKVLQFFVLHAMLSVVVNRVLAEATSLLFIADYGGGGGASIDEYFDFSLCSDDDEYGREAGEGGGGQPAAGSDLDLDLDLDMTLKSDRRHTRELSRRVWMCIPQMRRLKPLACMQFLAALMISFEAAESGMGAGADERSLVLGALLEFDDFRARFPRDPVVLEATVLAVSRLMTGRSPVRRRLGAVG